MCSTDMRLRDHAREVLADALTDAHNNGEEEILEYADAAMDAFVGFLADHQFACRTANAGTHPKGSPWCEHLGIRFLIEELSPS